TRESDWFTLREARLQVPSYTHPHLPLVVAASSSPAGPTAAGTYGLGMVSFVQPNPSDPVDPTGLAKMWRWAEEAAQNAGKAISRASWSPVLPIYVAKSREEALADVAEGCAHFYNTYYRQTLGAAVPAGAEHVEAQIASGA